MVNVSSNNMKINKFKIISDSNGDGWVVMWWKFVYYIV